MAKVVDLPRGTIIAGRYRVVGPAGSGGMGVVYVVEHVNTGGRAALKIMRERATKRAVERFRREARASAIIQSDHVVRVNDADVAPELEDAPFLVMELLHGEDLADRIARERRLSPKVTVDILAQVARGLDRAHAAGVVHRDLKPQNIFLHRPSDGPEMVKIVDFGISRIRPRVDRIDSTGLTRAEDVFGTPAWMSPEQAMSMHHAVGPATDIWAVGLIAFRMLTGRSYWGDREAEQIQDALMKPERQPPSELDKSLPPGFDRWFARSCSREPERRYQSALEQIESLAVALGVESPRLAPLPTFGSPGPSDGLEPLPATSGLDVTPPTDVGHEFRKLPADFDVVGEKTQVTGPPVTTDELPRAAPVIDGSKPGKAAVGVPVVHEVDDDEEEEHDIQTRTVEMAARPAPPWLARPGVPAPTIKMAAPLPRPAPPARRQLSWGLPAALALGAVVLVIASVWLLVPTLRKLGPSGASSVSSGAVPVPRGAPSAPNPSASIPEEPPSANPDPSPEALPRPKPKRPPPPR